MFKDVLNHANLSLYAQIGLVIFFVVFAAVVLHTLLRSRRDVDACAALPLSDHPMIGKEQP